MTAAGWVVLAALLVGFCATVAAWRGQTRIDEALATLDHDDGQFDGPTEQAITEALAMVDDNWWRPRLTSVPLPGDTVPDDRPEKEFMDRVRLRLLEEHARLRGEL